MRMLTYGLLNVIVPLVLHDERTFPILSSSCLEGEERKLEKVPRRGEQGLLQGRAQAKSDHAAPASFVTGGTWLAFYTEWQ